MKKGLLVFALMLLFIFQLNNNTHAGYMDKLIDPKDGMLDASTWLLDHSGFLPVPIIITEPAVGYGAGLGLIFFHESMAQKKERMTNALEEEETGIKKKMLPPSLSGVFGAKTENGTWGAGGFHFGSWKDDNIRYTGGLAKFSANLDFYGTSEDSILSDGLGYNLEGWAVLQELKFRMSESDVFMGAKLVYMDSTSTFDLSQVPIEVDNWELDYSNVGFGLVIDYDSRDNIFTPESGVSTHIETTFYNGDGLGDQTREYQITGADNKMFWRLHPKWLLGWRLGGDFSSGDVPFYALPYIDLRGIPVARYQGTHVLETELEAMYQLSYRWGLLGFGGVGQTADSLNDFGENENRWAGGVGFRYLIARAMRLYSGVDIARGPEDWAIYIQVGSGL